MSNPPDDGCEWTDINAYGASCLSLVSGVLGVDVGEKCNTCERNAEAYAKWCDDNRRANAEFRGEA